MPEQSEKVSLDSLVKPEVIEIEEEFGARSSHSFKKCVEEAVDMGCRQIVLDFHKTKSLDSVSLESLLWAHDRMVEVEGSIRICRLSAMARKIIEIVQFERLFEAHDDVASAVNAFA